jgi:hypothetical protein
VAARRPASWLALVAAAVATWSIAPRADGWWPAAALAAGAAVAAAGLGSLPREGGAAWAAWRAAWPAAGAVIGWLASGAVPSAAGVPCTVVATCAATAVTVAAAARARLAPAEATGCGLAAGLAAAAAGCLAATPSLGVAWPALAAACWGLVTVVVPRLGRRAAEAVAPSRGPLGGALPRAAMASALGAMVVFLFLAPHLAWGYAVVAVGWLFAIVLPWAALGPGRDGDAARRALVTTAGQRCRPEAAAARLVAAYAAVLVWPPLVAAVLAGSAGAAARPLAIAAVVAALAGALAALTVAALAAGCSRDTAHAVALCAAVAAGAGLADRAFAPANQVPGLMLSNPADPATLPRPREEPRLIRSPQGVVSCPASPLPASCRRSESRPRSCSC